MSINNTKRASIILVPYEIFKVLSINKHNIIDLLTYEKLRNSVVVNDVATLVAMNRELKIEDKHLSTTDVTNMFSISTKEYTDEYNNIVLPISLDKEIIDSMNTNLLSKEIDANSMTDVYYSFIQTEDHIFLVLRKGFLSRLTDSNYKLEFVKTYLKQCYSVTDIASVSTIPMFSTYVKKLFSNGQ